MKKETGFPCRLKAAVPARNIIMESLNQGVKAIFNTGNSEIERFIKMKKTRAKN